MQGMSERQYAAHVGLSRGAIQTVKTAERLALFADGSIDAEASDVRRAGQSCREFTTADSKTGKDEVAFPADAKVAEICFVHASVQYHFKQDRARCGQQNSKVNRVFALGVRRGLLAA